MSPASSLTNLLPKAIIVGCAGTVLSDEEKRFFRDFDPLGFILFQRNCETPDQVRALIATLRDCIGRDDAPILIDQEGGRVARLKPPHWPKFPPMSVFGDIARDDLSTATLACKINARLIAHELNQLGIDVNCAPVLDVPVEGAHAVIGDRAFSSDPAIITELGLQVCEGLRGGGIIPIIKHVPGHGRAKADSHIELPTVDANMIDLETTDFIPFIEFGRKRNADRVWAMVAHVKYTMIDSVNPASTSRKVISEAIRSTIGFGGVLISDDICMNALHGSLAERAESTLASGNDLTMHCSGKMEEMLEIAQVVRSLSLESAERLDRVRLSTAQNRTALTPEGIAEARDVLKQLIPEYGE